MIYYENSKGEQINLEEWPIVIQDKEVLYKNNWKYESKTITDNRGVVTRFYKELAEKTITLSVFADTEDEYNNTMKRYMDVTEYDIYKLQAGKLWIGEYYLSCYLIGNDYSEYEENFYSVEKKVTILAESSLWIKEKTVEFRPGSTAKAGQNLNFPFNFPFNFANNLANMKIENATVAPINFKVVIYGACVNPSIIIGKHYYSVDSIVSTGEMLIINSRDKTVNFIKIDGTQESAYDNRSREYYIFEKIPSGINSVSWNGLFGFDLTLYEERGEPEWI